MKIFCPITDDYFNCIDPTKPVKLSRALKMHFRKHNIDLFEVLKKLGFNLIQCAFCNEYNTQFTIISNIHDNQIAITDIDYTELGKKQTLHYCYTNKNCPGKLLNPNSIEFISISQKITKSDARKLLHERNKSPFYRCNHSSEEEYKKSQARPKEWFIEQGLDYDSILERRIFNGSLERYQQEFGNKAGFDIWKQNQKNKAITIENLSAKYGDKEAKRIHTNWLKECQFSLKNYIRKFGDIQGRLKYIEAVSKKTKTDIVVKDLNTFLQYLLCQITKDSTYVLHDYPLEKKILDLPISEPSLKIFKKDINVICHLLKNLNPLIQSFDNSEFYDSRKRAGFGIITYTDKGEMLRSKEELAFYLKLKKAGLIEVDYQIDANYPGSNQRFDFVFPKANVYIEIAPLCLRDPEYNAKMMRKKKEFNCKVLITQDDQDKLIKELKEFYYG